MDFSLCTLHFALYVDCYHPVMAQWLVKEEPEHYGYNQLEKDRKTVWAEFSFGAAGIASETA